MEKLASAKHHKSLITNELLSQLSARDQGNFARQHPSLTSLLVLFTLALAGGDLLELTSAGSRLTHSSAFLYFHAVHDILALGLVLFAAYHWSPTLGKLLGSVFAVVHLPYFAVTFGTENAEHVQLLLTMVLGYGGIVVVEKLHDAVRTAKKAASVSLHLSAHDALTQLPNRVLFAERIEQAIRDSAADGSQFSLLYVDLDRFKEVNDSLGHMVGDQLLQVVADRLRASVHADDMVARLGGDEFAVIALHVKSDNHSSMLAERIRETLSQPKTIEDRVIYTSPSIGIANYPMDFLGESVDSEKLLSYADMAMYGAKAKGRNAVQLYNPEMTTSLKRQIELMSSLREAMEKDELFLVYQPIVDLCSGLMAGAEALLRWNHPCDGAIDPLDFIASAEDNGLLFPIGEWVLNTACMQNRIWQNEGLRPIRVGVNISPVQLRRDDYGAIVKSALESAGLDPIYLDLELTESTFIRDLLSPASVLGMLQDLGVTFSIDDFGTGYRSLLRLKQLGIDKLKIDCAFIQDAVAAEDMRATAQAIVQLGHSLGMKVVAEGVETREQLEHVRLLGCDRAQGFYLARPMCRNQLAESLSQDAPLLMDQPPQPFSHM